MRHLSLPFRISQFKKEEKKERKKEEEEVVEACSLFFWRGEGEDTTLSFSTTLCKTIKLLELEKRNGTKQKKQGKAKGTRGNEECAFRQ